MAIDPSALLIPVLKFTKVRKYALMLLLVQM